MAIPAARSGRGKITLTAQGRFLELDAMTDEADKISVDECVEIISTDNDCTVVKRITVSEADSAAEQENIEKQDNILKENIND